MVETLDQVKSVCFAKVVYLQLVREELGVKGILSGLVSSAETC